MKEINGYPVIGWFDHGEPPEHTRHRKTILVYKGKEAVHSWVVASHFDNDEGWSESRYLDSKQRALNEFADRVKEYPYVVTCAMFETSEVPKEDQKKVADHRNEQLMQGE